MNHPHLLLLTLPLVALTLACAEDKDEQTEPEIQPQIETEINPDVDFSDYESFHVLDPEAAAGTEPPENFSAYKAEITSSIIDELTSKGLTDDPDDPDLFVNPLVSVEQVNDPKSFYSGYWGYYYGYEYLWTVNYDYTEGSLILDVVDRRDLEDQADDLLVYRGVAVGLLGEDEDVIKLQIRNTAHALFADWPE